MSFIAKVIACIPWSKSEYKNSKRLVCSSQDGLRQARKQDVQGNYDIDGVSFDGDCLYMSGRFKDSQS